MGLLLDFVILLIIFISIFINYKRGFIKVAFRLVSFIIAIIISLLLYRPVANFITNYTPISNKIETQIENRLSSEDEETTNNFVENYYKNIKNSSINIIAHNMTNSIINISSAIIVFLLTRFILFFLRFSTDIIAKLPLIKQINHIGGFVYGIVAGFVVIYLFFTIISILAPIINLNNFIVLIDSSIIGNIMYNNNIIFMFLV